MLGKISGAQLLKNMTDPLPVKVLGGTIEDAEKMGFFKMPEYSRDPRPKNGDAYDLLSSDLLAFKTGVLTHPFEAREKELLKVGERLGLRGEEVDKLIGEVISKDGSLPRRGQRCLRGHGAHRDRGRLPTRGHRQTQPPLRTLRGQGSRAGRTMGTNHHRGNHCSWEWRSLSSRRVLRPQKSGNLRNDRHASVLWHRTT